jgi:hypothetical protein
MLRSDLLLTSSELKIKPNKKAAGSYIHLASFSTLKLEELYFLEAWVNFNKINGVTSNTEP